MEEQSTETENEVYQMAKKIYGGKFQQIPATPSSFQKIDSVGSNMCFVGEKRSIPEQDNFSTFQNVSTLVPQSQPETFVAQKTFEEPSGAPKKPSFITKAPPPLSVGRNNQEFFPVSPKNFAEMPNLNEKFKIPSNLPTPQAYFSPLGIHGPMEFDVGSTPLYHSTLHHGSTKVEEATFTTFDLGNKRVFEVPPGGQPQMVEAYLNTVNRSYNTVDPSHVVPFNSTSQNYLRMSDLSQIQNLLLSNLKVPQNYGELGPNLARFLPQECAIPGSTSGTSRTSTVNHEQELNFFRSSSFPVVSNLSPADGYAWIQEVNRKRSTLPVEHHWGSRGVKKS